MAEDDRISRLSKRFKTHAVGRPRASNRARDRQSFYLDVELVARLDKTYRDLSHKLYPRTLSKAAFQETIIEYALDHLDELHDALLEASEDSPSS